MTDSLEVTLRQKDVDALMQRMTPRRFSSFARDLTRKLAFDTINAIVQATPVDTGRLKHGWSALFRQGWARSSFPGGGRDRRAQAEGIRASRVQEVSLSASYGVAVINSVVYVGFVEQRYGFVRAAVTREFARFRTELDRDVGAFLREG